MLSASTRHWWWLTRPSSIRDTALKTLASAADQEITPLYIASRRPATSSSLRYINQTWLFCHGKNPDLVTLFSLFYCHLDGANCTPDTYIDMVGALNSSTQTIRHRRIRAIQADAIRGYGCKMNVVRGSFDRYE